MEINRDAQLFWYKIEFDLKLGVPNHIKNSFCLYGYSTALSFKNVDADAINDVEIFIREELFELIQQKFTQDNKEINVFVKRDFFGIFEDHKKFRFSEYDLELIGRIVQHVKDTSEKRRERFSVDNNKYPQWLSSWFYETKTDIEEQQNDSEDEHPTQTHRILSKFLKTADLNSKRPKGGFRFDESTQSYAAYLRCLVGPIAYKTIQKNLSHALPSLTTTNRFIARPHYKIVEGEPRFNELLIYLDERKLTRSVSLSEDQTRIYNRVQYDSNTNQLIGFVAPINENGMPIPFFYKARSASEIISHFSSNVPVANYVNTVIAQPTDDAPSFCLLIFGSDGKYTSNQVIKRWNFIVAELKKLDIEVVSISSDSDPRYNAAMRKCSQLGTAPSELLPVEWFSCGNRSSFPFFIQDTPHIATKLRNWFLKTKGRKNAKKIPFGNKYYIHADHVQFLLETESKAKHRLTNTVLNPIDRQNYDSAKRICHQRVTDLLSFKVRNSDATIKFLEIVRNQIDAFEDEALSPLARIEKLWYSLFMVRLWRKHVKESKKLTLKDHFLTNNCYSCLELNAHGLMSIMLYLKSSNQSHLFKPVNYSSQPCEAFYRQIRSMSTVYSTVTNCTEKEILGRAKKIQLQNNISVSNKEFIFPQHSSLNESSKRNTFGLPTHDKIIQTVEKCKKQAIEDAVKLGLINSKMTEIPCELKQSCIVSNKNLHKNFAAMNIQDEPMNTFQFDKLYEDMYAKNFANKINKSIKETSPYVEIYDVEKPLIVQKTYLCWLLSKDRVKLSSDRLQRVQNSYDYQKKKRLTLKKTIHRYSKVKKHAKKIKQQIKYK